MGIEKKIKGFVDSCSWRWAKTYRTIPHEYIVRGKCELTDSEFVEFVHAQRDYGVKERWGKYNFPYLYIDGYKYWTMGDTIDNTIIINRQKVFGEYDKIASEYDNLFKDDFSKHQDSQIYEMFLSKMQGSIFDLGCGTGLLIELMHFNIGPKDYNGIDPSKKMIEKFREKNPDFKESVRCTSFEEDGEKYYSYDNVVALYGSCSYVMKPYIEMLAKRHKKVLLMFYKEDYSPITYEKTGVSMHHFIYRKEWLEKTFSSCRVISFYQYNIVTNI